jgi:enterobactin synthetase component D
LNRGSSEDSLFIESEEIIFIANLTEIAIYQSCYGVESYKDELFLEFDIYFPENLLNAVDKRKAEYLAGRYCASRALVSLGEYDFKLLSDENRCPMWPVTIKGSISHTNDTAISAVTSASDIVGVGIDIENIISREIKERIETQIIFKNEIKWLSNSNYSPEQVFTLIYSIKESFFKAVYPSVGYYFDFDAVQIKSIDYNNNKITLVLCIELSSYLKKGLEVQGEFLMGAKKILSLLILRKSS